MSVSTRKTNAQAVREFCSIEGFDDGLLACQLLYVNPGTPNAICMNLDCDYTELMEDDQDAGWCSECKTNTLKSIQVLMGII